MQPQFVQTDNHLGTDAGDPVLQHGSPGDMFKRTYCTILDAGRDTFMTLVKVHGRITAFLDLYLAGRTADK